MTEFRRFFAREAEGDRVDAESGYVSLVSEFNHISRVLRMKVGDSAVVCGAGGTEFLCRVDGFEGGAVRLKIMQAQKNTAEPADVTLFFGALKGANTAFVVQKGVELGAARLVPFVSAHTVSDVDEKKAAHLSAVALEACKQCGRARVPQVTAAVSFAQLLDALTAFEQKNVLFCYEKGGGEIVNAVRNINKRGKIAVIIGAEGGFSDAEAARLAALATPVSLSRRILRAETASVAALAVLDALLGA